MSAERWRTAIPRKRVMNFERRGAGSPPGTPISKMCGARVLDANMDDPACNDLQGLHVAGSDSEGPE